METNLKDLTDFLDNYSITYTIENDIVVAGDIDLSYKNISELPESIGNLKCNYIDLSNNKISELPESIGNLKCNNIYLSSNNINKLPESFGNLKCNFIYLSNNKIIELPESFGNLKCNIIYLDHNKISKLPESFGNLKCNYIDLSNNNLTTEYTTKDFKEIEITDEYIYCDGILTWLKGVKQINEYIVYLGEFNDFVVTKDNLVFAHGNSIRQAIADLIFKLSDRDSSKYKSLNLEQQLSIEEAIVMYRTITGACSYGVESFMLNKPFNDTISINEIDSLLNNDFGAEIFRNFFNIDIQRKLNDERLKKKFENGK